MSSLWIAFLVLQAGLVPLLSLIAWAVFAWDQRAARKRRWRVSERTLLGWSLLGGWPGAWLAMRGLRHKTVKRSFRRRFFAAVVLHGLFVVGMTWWLWRAAA
jgi:uncharacterized membrane protein YsdA (DUF1294 family)